jgi:carboxypeptidase T
MTKNVLLVILAFAFVSENAGAVKQRVFVNATDPARLEALLKNPKLDILRVKTGHGVECLIADAVTESLRVEGYKIDVITADVIAYNRKIKAGYKSASFGPYYSYAEAVAEMNDLHTQYPGLVSVPESLGAGWEHRPVWAFKVSNSPGTNNGKPGALYTGVHHAREPICVTICLGFAKYLCQNYATDPEVKWLVDNRQIWFVPIVNPDGYVYNQTYPDSMWRKNKRNNGDGSYGVDLNRNYPYMWGFDNSGSSPYTTDETYRGPSAGSEPEVQAVMSLVVRENCFVTVLNYHSYSNLLIYPWGYMNMDTPDSLVYRDLAAEIVSYNGYTYGTCSQVLAYTSNGDADDWLYGEELEKPRCYPLTPEVGDWFWQADTATIMQQFAENLMPNILAAQAAGACLVHTGRVIVSGGDGDTLAEPGEQIDYLLELKNRGIEASSQEVQAIARSDDPYIDMLKADGNYGDFAPREEKSNASSPFTAKIDTSCPPLRFIDLTLSLTDKSGQTYPGSAQLRVRGIGSKIDTIFEDDVESGAGTWVHDGPNDLWHVSSYSSHSPSHSWYCGTEGSGYVDNMNCRLSYGPLTAKRFYELTFWHRYGLEEDWDYSYIEISTDGGATWQQACPRLNGTAGWAKATVDLSAYTGTITIGFRLCSDVSVTDEGWYLDDIVVTGIFDTNEVPGQPLAIAPTGGEEVPDSFPVLTVSNATDPDGDPLTYCFKIYGDSLLTDIYDQAQGISEGSGSTAWQLTKALVPGQYWWRAYADDGTERGLFSRAATFVYKPTGVEGRDYHESLPAEYRLEAFHPNPTTKGTAIAFQTPKTGQLELKVYSITGQLVRILVNGQQPAGYHKTYWNGCNHTGQPVASGVYFFRMAAPGYHCTQKLVVLR